MRQAGRYRGTGKPTLAIALQARLFGRDPISAEGIMASGPCAPHQQAEHMAAPTSTAETFKITLANGEPFTHGEVRPRKHSAADRQLFIKAAAPGVSRISVKPRQYQTVAAR
jgi:hypothetical protein